MTEKIDVKGDQQHPLQMAHRQRIEWYEKYFSEMEFSKVFS